MQAKIFFGDVEVTKTQTQTIKNPYDGKVVAEYPACNVSIYDCVKDYGELIDKVLR